MYYSQLNPFDTTNGEGVRVSLFVSGCSLNCRGCFNKEAQNYRYGEEFTYSTLREIKRELVRNGVDGLSILGGDPLAEKNRDTVLIICRHLKSFLPYKTIWLWSGYTLEEIQESFPEILPFLDVLVDGRYVEALKDDSLHWRGSSNQRVHKLRLMKP